MTVFVDDVEIPFGNMIMCHCWADTLEELLAMMDLIAVQRKWIQGHPKLSLPQFRKVSWVHFDISLGKKMKAIKQGAVLTDRYGPLEHKAKLDIASGDATRMIRGTKMLAMVTESRAL